MTDQEHRKAMQRAADEARDDELRLVTNYLCSAGVYSWTEAAAELMELCHRNEDIDLT